MQINPGKKLLCNKTGKLGYGVFISRCAELRKYIVEQELIFLYDIYGFGGGGR